MKQICRRLRLLRTENRLTQQNIADFLGTTQQMYSRYETGSIEMPSRHLVRLADLYHISSDYLLGRTDSPSL